MDKQKMLHLLHATLAFMAAAMFVTPIAYIGATPSWSIAIGCVTGACAVGIVTLREIILKDGVVNTKEVSQNVVPALIGGALGGAAVWALIYWLFY